MIFAGTLCRETEAEIKGADSGCSIIRTRGILTYDIRGLNGIGSAFFKQYFILRLVSVFAVLASPVDQSARCADAESYRWGWRCAVGKRDELSAADQPVVIASVNPYRKSMVHIIDPDKPGIQTVVCLGCRYAVEGTGFAPVIARNRAVSIKAVDMNIVIDSITIVDYRPDRVFRRIVAPQDRRREPDKERSVPA